MIAFILAGGKGTRLKGMTPDNLPKPMINIAGKPVLQYQIEFLARNKIHEVIISAGYGAEAIKKYFGDGERYDLVIKYSEESEPLGTAGAFKYAAPLFNAVKDILVLYGDIIFDIDINRLINFHNMNSGLGTLLVHPNDHPFDSDLLEINRENKIMKFISKPHPADRYYQNLVNAGIYVLKPEVACFIESGRQLDFGKDVFPAMVDEGKDFYVYRTSEYIKDIGSVQRHKEVEQDILGGKVNRRNLINRQKAIFLDRDGVINKEVSYLCRPEQLEILECSTRAVRKINHSDYLAIVATNQSAVARGLCSEEDIAGVNQKLDALLGEKHAYLDGIYYCPHHPDKGFEGENARYKIECECRKPNTGMIRQAQRDFNIDLKKSFIIGDTTSDIMTGINACIKTILVRTGYAGKDRKYDCRPDFIFENLKEAVDFIMDDYEKLSAQINHLISPMLKMSKKPFVISIGGLSRSGKSTIARMISIVLANHGVRSITLGLDNWLVDLNNRESWMSVRERYDYHKIEEDIRSFLAGNEIIIHQYNAETRQKSVNAEGIIFDNYEAVIIDGAVSLDIAYLREISSLKIFVDIDEALREERFNAFYRYKGLTGNEIAELYVARQKDEHPFIVEGKKYADHVFAFKGDTQ